MTSPRRIASSLFAVSRKLTRGAGLHESAYSAQLRITGRPIQPPPSTPTPPPPPLSIVGPDNVVRSPYPDVAIPDCSVYHHVFSRIGENGRKVAIVDGVSGREYSYSEIYESVAKFSSGLNRLGFQKGEVLVLCTSNCIMFPVVFYGTLASGGVVSTCNPASTWEELAHQFKSSSAKYVATMSAFLPAVKKAAEVAGVPSIILVDDHAPRDHGHLSYHALVADSGSRFLEHKVDPKNDLAMLPYSSGTTGLPKGVMLTHHNLVANAYQYCHPQYMDLTPPGTTLIGVLPFYHVYGFAIIMMSSLWQGSKLIALPKFDPTLFLSTLQRYRVDFAHLVPPLILFLAKHTDVDKYNLSSLRQIMSAAAPLGGDLARAVAQRLSGGQCIIRQGYGLTETSPLSHLTPFYIGMSRPSTVGVPVRNQLVKVVDIQTGESLPANQEGEILIKGPNVMKGYLNQPEATSRTVTEDGWLRSGDIGYYDQEGFFYITDRLKELIKVKGLQVAPAELEALLLGHPKVADAAVVGVSHERHGEAPRAFVVKRDPSVTEKELADYVASHVSEHKRLEGGVRFIETIPKTPSGKILRRLLKNVS